jgi:hypothetical protein
MSLKFKLYLIHWPNTVSRKKHTLISISKIYWAQCLAALHKIKKHASQTKTTEQRTNPKASSQGPGRAHEIAIKFFRRDTKKSNKNNTMSTLMTTSRFKASRLQRRAAARLHVDKGCGTQPKTTTTTTTTSCLRYLRLFLLANGAFQLFYLYGTTCKTKATWRTIHRPLLIMTMLAVLIGVVLLLLLRLATNNNNKNNSSRGNAAGAALRLVADPQQPTTTTTKTTTSATPWLMRSLQLFFLANVAFQLLFLFVTSNRVRGSFIVAADNAAAAASSTGKTNKNDLKYYNMSSIDRHDYYETKILRVQSAFLAETVAAFLRGRRGASAAAKVQPTYHQQQLQQPPPLFQAAGAAQGAAAASAALLALRQLAAPPPSHQHHHHHHPNAQVISYQHQQQQQQQQPQQSAVIEQQRQQQRRPRGVGGKLTRSQLILQQQQQQQQQQHQQAPPPPPQEPEQQRQQEWVENIGGRKYRVVTRRREKARATAATDSFG